MSPKAASAVAGTATCFHKAFVEQTKSDPADMASQVNGIVAILGSLAHSHFNCMMRNMLAGIQGRTSAVGPVPDPSKVGTCLASGGPGASSDRTTGSVLRHGGPLQEIPSRQVCRKTMLWGEWNLPGLRDFGLAPERFGSRFRWTNAEYWCFVLQLRGRHEF